MLETEQPSLAEGKNGETVKKKVFAEGDYTEKDRGGIWIPSQKATLRRFLGERWNPIRESPGKGFGRKRPKRESGLRNGTSTWGGGGLSAEPKRTN